MTSMRYISTRGKAPDLGFADVLLTGLARDGGLYVPSTWPQISKQQQADLRELNYQELLPEILAPYVGDSFTKPELAEIANEAYERFRHPAVAPMIQARPKLWIMELFHGPTLAFKDFALQVLGLMFDAVLAKQKRQITVVGATSGDTGSAAIEACRDKENIDIFILHPKGRVSDVQRRQMTTVTSSNVHNVAVEGSFDDCQDLVKALFNDLEFRDEVGLSAVNSINWARILSQIVYYAYAALQLGRDGKPIDVVVPTGNFGNVFAAYGAKAMGFDIDHFYVASNRNDILARFFSENDMSMQPVTPSLSPSMDIQVSSNFERLLFDLMDRDGAAVSDTIKDFRDSGKLSIGQGNWQKATEAFSALACDDEQTKAAMKKIFEESGYLADPHTATGIHLDSELANDSGNPRVLMATAHPAKFPDAVEAAVGQVPTLPPHLADLHERSERLIGMKNSIEDLQAMVREKRRL